MEKVTEESLFNTLQSLNTREHPIKKCNGRVCDKEKEVPFHRKVIGLRSSFLLVETQSPNRLQTHLWKLHQMLIIKYDNADANSGSVYYCLQDTGRI